MRGTNDALRSKVAFGLVRPRFFRHVEHAERLQVPSSQLGNKFLPVCFLSITQDFLQDSTDPDDVFIRICCHLVFDQLKVLFLLPFVSFIGHSV